MNTESHEISERTASGKSRPPRDVRILAYVSCFAGFGGVLVSILLCTGLTEPDEPYPVFLGGVVLANRLTQAVYTLFISLCCLFIAWGLMRGMKSAWRLAIIGCVYGLAEGLSQFRGHPVAVTIGMSLYMLLIGWLWFRRELYGAHLAGNHIRK